MERHPSAPAAGPWTVLWLVLALATGGWVLWLGQHLHPLVLAHDDLWFDGDTARVYAQMTDRLGSGHARNNLHPLASWLLYPPVAALHALGLSLRSAAAAVLALVAALSAGLLAATLRRAGATALSTVAALALHAASASFVFWSAVPETFLLGGVSVLACVALALPARVPATSVLVANLLAAGVTVSNWSAGALLILRRGKTLRGMLACALAVWLLVLGISWAQRLVFPQAASLLQQSAQREASFMHWPPDAARTGQVLRGVLLDTFVVAAPHAAPPPMRPFAVSIEGLRNEDFDGARYLRDHPDVAHTATVFGATTPEAMQRMGFEHYLRNGAAERRAAYDRAGRPLSIDPQAAKAGVRSWQGARETPAPFEGAVMALWAVLLGTGLVCALPALRPCFHVFTAALRGRSPQVAADAMAALDWLRASALLLLGYHFALHLVYGDETFLYAPHWTALLVLLACAPSRWPALDRWRAALALLLAAAAGWLNLQAFLQLQA